MGEVCWFLLSLATWKESHQSNAVPHRRCAPPVHFGGPRRIVAATRRFARRSPSTTAVGRCRISCEPAGSHHERLLWLWQTMNHLVRSSGITKHRLGPGSIRPSPRTAHGPISNRPIAPSTLVCLRPGVDLLGEVSASIIGRNVVPAMLHHARGRSHSGEGLFVDVGANIGMCTIHMLVATNATVVAFEPGADNLFFMSPPRPPR